MWLVHGEKDKNDRRRSSKDRQGHGKAMVSEEYGFCSDSD